MFLKILYSISRSPLHKNVEKHTKHMKTPAVRQFGTHRFNSYYILFLLYYLPPTPDPLQYHFYILLRKTGTILASILNPCIRETPKRVLLQTVKTQMKCSIMLHFIRVYTGF